MFNSTGLDRYDLKLGVHGRMGGVGGCVGVCHMCLCASVNIYR